MDTRGVKTVGNTTSGILILSGRNTDTANKARGYYAYGGYPRKEFTLTPNTNLIVPIVKQSFDKNLLTVTNNGGKMAIRLNGQTCYGIEIPTGPTDNPARLDKNQIGVNCKLPSREWCLAVDAPDRQLKTVVIYGIRGHVNEPYIIGLNCAEEGVCEAQSGAHYDAVFRGKDSAPLPLERMADVTVINLSSSGYDSPVEVQIY